MNIMVLSPPRRDGIVMKKEGRCMQRSGAFGYVMAPLTMVTLATMLRNAGHRAAVLDAGVEANDFGRMLERVRDFAPDIVLVNTTTTTIEDDLRATRLLKESLGRPIVAALYGIHVSVLYADTLRSCRQVDFCIIGEPEITAGELVAALAGGGDPRLVAGLAWLDQATGEILSSAERPFITDLDELPIPDWSFVDTGKYRLPFSHEKFLLINTNRGCPNRCSFCNAHAYYGRQPRRHSVARVISELHAGVERFGVTNFLFWSDEFLLDRDFAVQISEALVASGPRINWVCFSRVDSVDAEVLALIRKAGCWLIAFGIETGVEQILARTGKQTTTAQSVRAVQLARNAGLAVMGHVILGLPGETAETMRITDRFVRGLDLDFVQYYCAIPYPGSTLYEDARREGWITSSDWSRWEHNYSVMDLPGLKGASVMAARDRFFKRFYLRPKIIGRTIRRYIRRPGDLLTLARNVRDFLRWI